MLRIDYESKTTFKSYQIFPYCRDIQHIIFLTFVYIICHVSVSGTSCCLQLKREIYARFRRSFNTNKLCST